MSDSSKTPAAWREEARTLHADCVVFSVERRTFQHPTADKRGDFYVIRPRPWAVAMAQTRKGQWILVRQFRFGTQTMSWEFPSGCADAGEDLVAAASRELREETGYVGRDPVLLGTIDPNPAIQDNTCTYVYFRDAEPLEALAWDEHEEIELELVDDAELRARVRNGTMTHALMLAGLALWDAKKREM